MTELTDLEIERRIADIEGIHYMETKYAKNNFLALVSENDFTGTPPEMIGKYSPLTDDALCFQLMVKYDVKREWEPYDFIGWNYHCLENKNPERITERTYFGNGTEKPDISPSKAILLAIIEAHKES